MQFGVFPPTGNSENRTIDKFPDECPHCHKGIQPLPYQGFVNENQLQIIFRCPREDCRNIFIAYYENTVVNTVWTYVYYKSSIGTIQTREFSEEITEISENFVDILNQSLAAEKYGLSQIVGIGLRKALEFLIKDYIIYLNKDLEEDIKKKFLGNCIKENVDNPKIKSMAERAAWLGNDESHYMRKWLDKDISDLKILMEATIHWIEMEILTEKYKGEMK